MKIEINNSISISLFETEYTELSFGDQQIMIMNGSGEQRRILLPWKIIPDGQKISPSSSAETPLKVPAGQEFQTSIQKCEVRGPAPVEIKMTPKIEELKSDNVQKSPAKPHLPPLNPRGSARSSQIASREDLDFALKELRRIENSSSSTVYFSDSSCCPNTHSDFAKLLSQSIQLNGGQDGMKRLQAYCSNFYLDEKIIMDNLESEPIPGVLDSCDKITARIIQRHATIIRKIPVSVRLQILGRLNCEIAHKLDRIKWKDSKSNPRINHLDELE